MHAHLYASLKLSPRELRALVKLAAANALTLEELVGASVRGEGKRDVSEKAVGLVAAARAAAPKLAALKSWPHTCRFCRAQSKDDPATCLACKALGCAACVTGRGCPPCRAEATRRAADARREQEVTEAIAAAERRARAAHGKDKDDDGAI